MAATAAVGLVVVLGGLARAKCDYAEWDLSRVDEDMPTSTLPFESDAWIDEAEPGRYAFHSWDVSFSLRLVQ